MKNNKILLRRLSALLLCAVLLLPLLPVGSQALPPYTDGTDADFASELGLSDTEYLKLKEKLYGAIRSFATQVDLREYSIPVGSLGVFDKIIGLEPDFFYVVIHSYRHVRSASGDHITYLLFRYEQTAAELEQIRAAADTILDGIIGNSALTDAEKALLIHDRLALWCEYDETALETGFAAGSGYDIYGTLVDRVSVCQGYAETYCYLMNRIGIRTYLCPSTALNHIWNIVVIDGQKYYVDVTWDDPVSTFRGVVLHDYFLVSLEELTRDGIHNASDFERISSPGTYDSAAWHSVDSAFVLLDGRLLYVDTPTLELRDWNHGKPVTLLKHSCQWKTEAGIWSRNFPRTATDGKVLWYTLADSLCRYVPGQTAPDKYYIPDLSAYSSYAIFGMELRGGEILLDAANSPNKGMAGTTWDTITYVPSARKLTGIEILNAPARTLYFLGETVDPAGMELKLLYSNGSCGSTDRGYTLKNPVLTSAGTISVTVEYGGFSASFEVRSVEASEVCSIRLQPNGGIGTAVTVPALTGTVYNYPDAVFSRPGYRFVGWDTRPNAASAPYSGILISAGQAGGTLDLYSVWERDESFLYGDANGDGSVGSPDVLLLRKYFSDFNYVEGTSSISISAASDCNADGSVNSSDLLLLRIYLANFDYSTGKSSIQLGPQR